MGLAESARLRIQRIVPPRLQEVLPIVWSTVSSPQLNMQRTMELFDRIEDERQQNFQEEIPVVEETLELPPSLKHVLEPGMHEYIAIDLPQSLEGGTPIPWLTLVESFGMRAVAFEVGHEQAEQSIVVSENDATLELNLGQETSYASYTDPKMRLDASWTGRYHGEDWTLSGFSQCEIASQVVMKQGVIATNVNLQASEDRLEHTIIVTQVNLNDPSTLSYRFTGTYDRDGLPVPPKSEAK